MLPATTLARLVADLTLGCSRRQLSALAAAGLSLRPASACVCGAAKLLPSSCESRRFMKPRPNFQYKWHWEKVKDQLEEYTHKPLRIPRLGGRDPQTGHKVNQHVGGGIKWDYFLVDLKRVGPSDGFYEEKVLEIRPDPNRTSHIALVGGIRGKRWILATETMQVGMIVRTTAHIPAITIKGQEGDAHPVGALAPGTMVNCIEPHPGMGGHFVHAAGSYATVLRRQGELVVVQLPSKREVALKPSCMATVGRLSNVTHADIPIGSAAANRHRGVRPASGLWHKKDGYCGRKIRPLPPLKSYESAPPRGLEKLRITLTTRELNATFGPKAAHPLVHWQRHPMPPQYDVTGRF